MSAPKIATVLYKYKKYADGKHPIMIRITSNRKSNYIATGYSVFPESWDDENNRLIETRSKKYPEKKVLSNAKAINSDIEQKVSDVIRVKQQVSFLNDTQTSKFIKEKVVAKYSSSQNFIEYSKAHIKTLIENHKGSTAKNHNTVINRIETFNAGKVLFFDEVTIDFLNRYQSYLLNSGMKPNTSNFHLKTIRAILYKAMNESEPLLARDKNPFLKLKIKNHPTQKESLSEKEIEKIRKAKLKTPLHQKQIDARNYYLFSFNNAGIRISDVIQLKVKNVIDGRLHYEMGKTGHFKSIRLNQESQFILKQYKKRSAKPDDFLFPILDNTLDFSNPTVLREQVEWRI